MKDYFYTNCYQRNNNIYCRGYANGLPFIETIDDYQPYLFILNKDGEYKTLQGQSVSKKSFESIKDAQNFLQQYKDSNVNIYGLNQFTYTFINDEFPGVIDYNPKLISVVSIDIECKSSNGFPIPSEAAEEVTAITLTKGDNIVTFGTKVYTGQNKGYVFCIDEKELLYKFLEIWNSKEWAPDIVTGWNCEKFDIPYLVIRIGKILGGKFVKSLSPWGFVQERDIMRGKSSTNSKESQRQDTIYEMAGITQLDYMQLYKKFSPSASESYALNNIALHVLKEQKLDYSAYKSLDDLYEKNFDLYIEYNQHDALLVQKLEDKLGYIKQVIAVAYKAKINFLDAMATVRPWDIIIHNYLLDKKIVIPQSKSDGIERELIGAYVKDPKPGLYYNIISVDYEGEYPSVLSQLNISPETFVDKIGVPSIETIIQNESFGELTDLAKKHNCCIAANGCLYSRDKRGFIPELVDIFKADRKAVKERMKELKKLKDKTLDNEITRLDNQQLALKVLTNGMYGALSNKYFRWFDINLAESVTMTSQLATRYMEHCVNKYLNKLLKSQGVDYVIAADTDSNYINLNELVVQCGLSSRDTKDIIEFLDKVCKEKLEPYLERCNLELGKWLNSDKQVLRMIRDIIADKGVWRGKKMYILNTWDKEGFRYSEPELTMKGIEVVRSSTPMICRNKLKEALKIIMTKDEATLQQFVKDFEKKFYKLPADAIAFPRSVDGISEYYDPVSVCRKGTPIQTRGAIYYNEIIKDRGLTKTVPTIKNYDKIRFVYLKIPNPFQTHVISFPDTLPNDWGIKEYLDYDAMWDRAFQAPLKSITDVIGWNISSSGSLMSFFA